MKHKEEHTSKQKATLASKTLKDKNATKLNKSLAGELLRNAANKSKTKHKK